MIKLSTTEESKAKGWLKSLFMHALNAKESNAVALVDEMIGRQFTFITKNLDSCLQHMSNYRFHSKMHKQRLTATPEQGAKYYAWFCQSNPGLIWDDANCSVVELDAYKNTILGKALWEAECFASQKTTDSSANVSQSTRTRTVNTTPGGAPKSSYKSSGGHSGDIANLVGTANNKIKLTGIVFAIEADKIGANVPNAFITPLKATTSTPYFRAVTKQAAEIINMGSGNGYTDCKLWFTDPQIASDFAVKLAQRYTAFKNIRVVRANADSNGYFEVTTEYGNAYIKASKLNEELLEVLEEKNKTNVKNNINNIDAYDEGYFKSIS